MTSTSIGQLPGAILCGTIAVDANDEQDVAVSCPVRLQLQRKLLADELLSGAAARRRYSRRDPVWPYASGHQKAAREMVMPGVLAQHDDSCVPAIRHR
jgi:hypothetical protein